jgi:pimeloyl-ACP methyl ester carboxylesterase
MQSPKPASKFEECERRLLDHYELDVATRFIDVRRPPMRIRILEAGEGPPVLLLHGGGAFAAQWLPLLAELQGFRLIAIDCPGRGLSDRFDYTGVDVRAHGTALVGSVLDALGFEQAPVVGSSLGGYWALSFALQVPPRVSALVLLGSPGFVLDNASAPLALRLLGVPALGRLMLALSTPRGERRSWSTFAGKDAIARLPDDFFEYSHREIRLPGSPRAFTSLFRRLTGIGGLRRETCLSPDDLRRITTRTLLVWGSEDVVGGPELAERMCSHMPDARIELISAGHVPWFDDPALCARHIEAFLERGSRIRPGPRAAGERG